jgi:hypothetical protein
MTAVRDFAKKPYPCPNPKKNSPPIMTNIHPLFTVQHLQMYIPGFCEQLYNGKCYMKILHCNIIFVNNYCYDRSKVSKNL